MATMNIRDFFEMRRGLEGMQDFANATLRWMDDQGIALSTRTKRPKATNGNGHAPVNMDALRETVRSSFQQRARKVDPADVHEPDGQHMTLAEAAQLLKMSEANVRLLTKNGKLPAATYENRPSKAYPNKRARVQVLRLADVMAYGEARGIRKESRRSKASKASWTPERRAAQAARMRKHNPAKAKTRKKTKAKGRAKGWARKWYARLEQHGPEHVGDTAKAFGTTSASLLTSGAPFLKSGVIKKGKEKGLYAVGGPMPEATT